MLIKRAAECNYDIKGIEPEGTIVSRRWSFMPRNVLYLDEIVEECRLLPTVNLTPKQCHYLLEIELGSHL